MKKLILSLALATIALSSCTSPSTRIQGPVIWDINQINAKAKAIQAGEHNAFYEELKAQADSILKIEVNPSVMLKPEAPNSGDKHDYTSLARYWWPNPDTEDGLPYVRHDGRSNPELKKYDRDRIGELAESVRTLSLVYYISRDQRYADKAISRLRTWFIDPETRMNPNFNYAQIRKGQNGGNGTPFGVLDGLSFIPTLDAMSLLELSGALPQSVSDSIHVWFADMSHWMVTSKNGIAESHGKNNHAIAYDSQLIRYAIYGGQDSIARSVIEAFPSRRLATQVEPDGRMPAELARTTAFGYTNFNIEHMLDICDMAQKLGIDLYPANNRAIERAIDWMIPHSLDQNSFPYQQIYGWEIARKRFTHLVYRASAYGKTEEYKTYFEQHKSPQEDPLFEFLYL